MKRKGYLALGVMLVTGLVLGIASGNLSVVWNGPDTASAAPGGMPEALAKLEAKLDFMEPKLDGLAGDLKRHLDQLEAKLDKLEAKLDGKTLPPDDECPPDHKCDPGFIKR